MVALGPRDFPRNPRVRALRETRWYGIPMIHDSRSNRSLAVAIATGHRCGVRDPPGHPPNARLVLFTSLSNGTNSSFQSKESRESLLLSAWRAAAAARVLGESFSVTGSL